MGKGPEFGERGTWEVNDVGRTLYYKGLGPCREGETAVVVERTREGEWAVEGWGWTCYGYLV